MKEKLSDAISVIFATVIVLTIILLPLAFVIYPLFSPTIDISFTGISETKCIKGYEYISNKSFGGSVSFVQVIGDDGKPLKCGSNKE